MRIDGSGDVEVMQGKNLTWVFAGGSTHRARIRAEASDDLIFENGSGNAERMRILPTGGLTFNGDTATANALDDYEEGTWSPIVVGSTTSGTVSYTTRAGVYTKIGNTVSIQFYIIYTSGTGAGNLEITGLPYVPNGGGHYGGVTIGYLNNLSLSANNIATAWPGNGVNTLHFYQYPTGNGSSSPIPYDGAASIMASAVYRVA
jgi:hypothetical protein